jgi:7-keto-8-aminopelargonate synthetase-like enzyme
VFNQVNQKIMRKKIYDLMSEAMQTAKDWGIAHLTTDAHGFTSDTFKTGGKKYVNFALCDYLALGHDERLKLGAIKALEDHGFYASVSKTYIKLDIYEKAEELLSQVFGRPAVLFPRTTLAHIGVLPVITDTDDAIILDQQVHTSVRIAADLLKSYGNHVENLRHNRMDLLEERIIELKKKFRRIWFLSDGVYSTYGDTIPVNEIRNLMNKYEQLHLYVDDSHGMSWFGKNGKGFLHETLGYLPNMVLSTSLCKGFGAEGGVIVCYNEELRNRLTKCAAPLIFTSPISPSTLGAIIESAKIHTSDEIYTRQSELMSKVSLLNLTAQGLGLPLISNANTPIAFFAVGKTDMCAEICVKLMERGFYVNPFNFPAVPINNAGLRALVSLYQTDEHIRLMLIALRKEYDIALAKRNMTMEDIYKLFKATKEEKVPIH